MSTPITHGILVNFQIAGVPAKGVALTLGEPVSGHVLLGVSTFDGVSPIDYNNGLLTLPVTAVTAAVQTPAQIATNFARAALLYMAYEQNGTLPVNASGFPTTPAQQQEIAAYEQSLGANP